MASLFTTGTESQSSAVDLAAAMVGQIRDDVVAHPAWELVEELDFSNVSWCILRCLASGSGLTDDFYFVIGRTEDSGEVWFSVCEDYDVGTNTMSHFPVWNRNTDVTYDESGRHPATRVLGNANFDQNESNGPLIHRWFPQSSSVNWWIIVSEDTVTVAFNGSPNAFVHVGAYTYLGQQPNLLPVQIIGTEQVFGGITRNPALEAKTRTSTFNYAQLFHGGANLTNYTPYLIPLGFQGSWKSNDALQNNQRPVAEVGMAMVPHASNDTWPAQYGYALGKQKRMRFSSQAMPSGFSFGDAFALNGELWVPFKPDDGRIWNTGIGSL